MSATPPTNDTPLSIDGYQRKCLVRICWNGSSNQSLAAVLPSRSERKAAPSRPSGWWPSRFAGPLLLSPVLQAMPYQPSSWWSQKGEIAGKSKLLFCITYPRIEPLSLPVFPSRSLSLRLSFCLLLWSWHSSLLRELVTVFALLATGTASAFEKLAADVLVALGFLSFRRWHAGRIERFRGGYFGSGIWVWRGRWGGAWWRSRVEVWLRVRWDIWGWIG